MRLKNKKGAKEFVTKNEYIIKNPIDYKGKYKEIFKNKNKIELEIGVGKGDFIIQKALSKQINECKIHSIRRNTYRWNIL